MSTELTIRLVAAGMTLLAFCVSGCASGPDDTYGTSRGTSLNGTAVVASMLRHRGHQVRAAIRLTDELALSVGGIVRFAPYPGPPDRDEAAWYRNWLAGDPDRWLIYVVRDFDTAGEYWKSVRDGLGPSVDPARQAEADLERDRASGWVSRLPAKAKTAADPADWFAVDTAWTPPRACTKLSGPWSEGTDAAAAGLTVHEPIKLSRGQVLLAGDGKPLVLEKMVAGQERLLLIANGSFLLNEAVVNPARRPLAQLVIDWADRGEDQVAFVEGSFVLGGDGMPTLWDLLRRIRPLRWVAAQAGLAALLAALARAPRLGRPRPDPPSGADRPVEHAVALGALLARAHAAQQAHRLLDRYRRWRCPRAIAIGEPRTLAKSDDASARSDHSQT